MTGRAANMRACAAVLGFAAFAGCCQSVPEAAQPAVLTEAGAATMARVRAALEKEMGRAPIQLGPGDLAQSSVVSVLPLPPGRLEDRSLAKPTIFRLEIEDGACVLVRDDTRARIALEGVACRSAP